MVIEIDRNNIKYILHYPDKKLINGLLDNVNLKDKEILAIKLVDMQGIGEKLASIKMGVSRKTVQNYRRNAYRKIGFVWKDNKIVNDILKAS